MLSGCVARRCITDRLRSQLLHSGGIIGKSIISLNFNASIDGRAVTAEHAEDRISLETLHPPR